MSRRMKEIVEKLKPLCAKVSKILNLELLAANHTNARSMDTGRPITTPESGEPGFYGRKEEKSDIVRDITKGQHRDMDLKVLPIVGPGGIGKTTLTQEIYKEVENHFEVKLWVCVSLNFSVSWLTQEIADKIKKGENDCAEDRIEEGLKSKRFLLVLDDMWSCSRDEWNRFLVPFKKGQAKGSVILVTTRLPALAEIVKTTDHWIDLKCLDPESFKNLFRAHAFGDNQIMNNHNGLQDIGDKIVDKLKGSPLAAKTVGKLLKNNLDLAHWTRVLDSKEWESQNGDNDIMPALKLSFDYLPYHLQQCFSYSALFPEDYRFGEEEIVRFWIGLDVLHSRGKNKRIEDIGLSYLKELVNHGFFKKEEDENGSTYYIIHDLLHELAIKVAADECLIICSSNNLRSLQLPPSIRHLSINIDDSSVKDRKTFDIYKEEFSVLGERLKVENLHSLMLFGEHQGSFVNAFRGLFSKAKALRLIFIFGGKYRVEDLLCNFMNLVHLRYLRIQNDKYPKPQPPKNMSRFYHLRVLDLQGCEKCCDLPRHIRNLLKLRHFIVPDDVMHACVFGVGRLKSLQELRRFEVRKELNGFELRQIGHLLELCRSLRIDSLENVEGREEADGAKLIHKKYVQELILNWNAERCSIDPAGEEQVIEGLKPHSNLLKLSIIGYGGHTCPSWLAGLKNLESLCLDGVAWQTFPPIGDLQLVNEGAKEISSNIPSQHFKNLRRIELKNLARLERWIIRSTSDVLSHLEELNIRNCPELVELSFSYSTRSQQDQNTRFPRLHELIIEDCPKLLPPVPWTSARFPLTHVFSSVGLDLCWLFYGKSYDDDLVCLEIIRDEYAQDMTATFWTAFDFDKLTGLEKLVMRMCPPLPHDGLQKLSSTIKILDISGSPNIYNGKKLTEVLSCMPKISELKIFGCEKITRLSVMERLEATSSSIEEEEIAAEGLLLLPPQLQKLRIESCSKLSLIPNSPHENGGGLQGLCCLRSLRISDCPKFLTCYSLPSFSSCFPFPASLRSLSCICMEMLAPISNLAYLTELTILRCGNSGGVDLGCLLAHGCLHKLFVKEAPNLFPTESSENTPDILGQGLSFPSSELQSLWTDDVAGVLTAPICGLLSSSLTELDLNPNEEMECFTKEQDEALQLLTSLQQLDLSGCNKLQSLPAGLRKLTNLKTILIPDTPAIHSLHRGSFTDSLQALKIWRGDIRSMPKDRLPNSLRKLTIYSCSAIRSLPKDSLPDSLQELVISFCPAIRALPKGGFPSSLRLLDVSHCNNSKELKRQCQKLIGTIPIVYASD